MELPFCKVFVVRLISAKNLSVNACKWSELQAFKNSFTVIFVYIKIPIIEWFALQSKLNTKLFVSINVRGL